MAEIHPRPTDKQKKYIIDLLDDNIFFYTVLSVINDIRENNESDDRKKYNKWESLTKELIRNGKASLLLVALEQLVYNISDEQNSEHSIKEDMTPQKKSFESQTVKVYARDVASIVKKVKITDIAIKYGLKLKGNKCVCPFHNDKDPSMTFNDIKGVFHCFGCQESGNIITFIKKMEERNDNNRGSKKED